MAGLDDTRQLYEQAQKGDPTAFGSLAERYYPAIYGIAFSSVGNWSGAQDIAQETFLLAWSRKGALHNALAFPVWLRRIAENLSKNWIRSSDYRRRLAEHYRAVAAPVTRPESAADAQIDSQTQSADVRRALQSLPSHLREVVVLYYLHGESLHSAADSLGISENAAKKRLQRGRAKLRAHFETQWKQEMAQARHTMGTASARDRFLAGLVLGPAVPQLGKTAAAAGLGLWWQVTKQITVLSKTWMGVGAMTLKKTTTVGVAVLALAGATYWAVSRNAKIDTKPQAAERQVSNVASGKSRVEPASKLQPPQPALAVAAPSLPQSTEIVPVAIADPKDYITIRGTVVDPSRDPIAGADVSVAALGLPALSKDASPELSNAYREAYRKYSTSRGQFWNGKTDQNGGFSISNIRFAGSTLVTARAPGYMAGMKYFWIDDITKPREDITITLQPGKTIFGLLLSEDGKPVTDASIKLEAFVANSGLQGSTNGLVTFTDELGHFELDVDDSGVLSLSVNSDTYGPISFSGVVADPDQELVLRYPRGTAVVGTVTDENGRPVPNVDVRLEGTIVNSIEGGPSASARGGTFSAVTNAAGAYRIETVDPGQQYLTEVVGKDGTQLTQGPGIQELKPGMDHELNFVIKPQMTVRGTVIGRQTGKPLEGIAVIAFPAKMLDPAHQNGSPKKSWSTSSGPDGAYALTITGEGDTFGLLTSFRQSAFGGGGSGDPSLPTVSLRPGDDIEQDLSVDEPATRSFLLIDDEGTPIPNAAMSIVVNGDGFRIGYDLGASTGTDGRAIVTKVPPSGESFVTFVRDGYFMVNSRRLAAEPGAVVPEETVVMHRPANITLTAVGPSGSPIVRQTVEVEATFDQYGGATADVVTNDYGTGSVDAKLPATRGTLTFSHKVERNGESVKVSSQPVEVNLAHGENDLGVVTLPAE